MNAPQTIHTSVVSVVSYVSVKTSKSTPGRTNSYHPRFVPHVCARL